MDIAQAALLSTTVVLGIFFVVLGFQVFFVLRDLRFTLKRVNKVLADADEIADDIKGPVESASKIIGAVSTGAGLVHLMRHNRDFRGDKSKNPHLSSFLAGVLLIDNLTNLLGSKAAGKIKQEILKEGGEMLEGIVEDLGEVKEKIGEGISEVSEKILDHKEEKEEPKEAAIESSHEEKEDENKELESNQDEEAPKNVEHVQKKGVRRFFFKKHRSES